MKNKKIKKILRTYGIIGKVLCACAGGIGGFLIGGPFIAAFGAIIGMVGGHLFEKCVVSVN